MNPNQAAVLRVLANGERLTHAAIIERSGLDYVQAYSGMKVLLRGREPKMVKIGTWEQLCAETGETMGSIRKDAGVYALKGTPMLRPLPKGGVVQRRAPRKGGGSGVICPPPYVTGYRWGLR